MKPAQPQPQPGGERSAMAHTDLCVNGLIFHRSCKRKGSPQSNSFHVAWRTEWPRAAEHAGLRAPLRRTARVAVSSPTGVIGNRLLAGLPARDRAAVMAAAEHSILVPGQVLATAGARILQVLFPLEGFIALHAETDRRHSLAVALIGSEGVLGAPLVLGSRQWPLRAEVHGAGATLRIRTGDFERLLGETPALRDRLRRQLVQQYATLGRAAACAAFHGVERRLARWLLMVHDRAHGDRFSLTHRQLAHALGARRSGVTLAAGALQARMLIGYTRGHIVIRDREGLERAACSCYPRPRQSGVDRTAVQSRIAASHSTAHGDAPAAGATR